MNEEKNDFSPANSQSSDFPAKSEKNSLNRQQKISLAFLGVFTILIMIFGVWQFRYNLYDPFNYEKKIADNKANGLNTGSSNTNIGSDLKQLDTDSDGLNDYEELNTYQTSPYLEDTDSDGFSDKEEVMNNTNPNCPAGQNCNQTLGSDSNTSNSSGSSLNTDQSATPDSAVDQEKLLSEMLSGQVDLAVLRKMLLDSGMSSGTLSQISDEDLLSIYQETLTKEE